MKSLDIKYIGVDDLELDLFESQYPLADGVSYNSYLIMDDKIAVMDCVDKRRTDEWISSLQCELQGRKPDYLVVHHMEPDHSAGIAAFVERYPDVTVVASARAIQMLPQFFETELAGVKTMAVKEGDVLPLGKHELTFYAAPMVHWPEVMVSYESAEKILFSADAFGKFGALCREQEWADEACRYYINIVGKYGVQVQALLKKVSALDVEIIAPLHGPVLDENLSYYIDLYNTWSSYKPEIDGVFIAYASIYGGTAKAASHLARELRNRGVNVAVVDLTREDKSLAVATAFRYSKMVLAASSYDGGLFTPMHDFLYRLQIKSYQQRTVGIIENGSWAPVSGRVMREMVEKMKQVDIIEPVVTLRSTMHQADMEAIEQLVKNLCCK